MACCGQNELANDSQGVEASQGYLVAKKRANVSANIRSLEQRYANNTLKSVVVLHDIGGPPLAEIQEAVQKSKLPPEIMVWP